MHEGNGNGTKPKARNVVGGELQICCTAPMTGFYRNGKCETGTEDRGVHTVCVEMTAEFLEYSKSRGNDLSSPAPGFPGLKPGDKWCLCAARWKEAFDDGVAPLVLLDATHEATLHYVSLDELKLHANDAA